MLYPKLLIIKNIKKIEELIVQFPQFTPEVKEGVKLVGNNYIGKTTVLQCLNYVLQNDINTNQAAFDLSTVIREGQIEGSIELHLLSSTGENVLATVKFKEELGKVTETFVVKTLLKTLTKKSDIKALFNYHYISANEIIRLSSSKPGRRELMEHFLNSVSSEVKQEFITLSDKEEAAYKLRTPLNVRQEELKIVAENSKPNAAEIEELKQHEFYKTALQTANSHIDIIKGELATAKDKQNEIELAKNLVAAYHGNIKEYEYSIAKIEENINNKLSTLVAIEAEFNRKLSDMIASLSGLKLKDIAKVKEILENGKLEISNISTVETFHEELDIANCKGEIKNLQEKIAIKEQYIKELENSVNLVDTKAKEDSLGGWLYERGLAEEKINAGIKLIAKAETYKNNKINYDKVYTEWKLQDDIVKDCRTKKEELIKSSNIEVDNFEFSPDGVKLKGYEFAESSISGADRRIAAAQFTMAMNKVIKLVILEEMESLDADEERRIAKFAADRGYIIVSDNVVKDKSDTIKIEYFSIS